MTYTDYLSAAATDAAASSWDAHEEFVDPEMVYDFTYQLFDSGVDWNYEDGGYVLPEIMPAEWPELYHQACMKLAARLQKESADRTAAMLAGAQKDADWTRRMVEENAGVGDALYWIDLLTAPCDRERLVDMCMSMRAERMMRETNPMNGRRWQ